MNLRSIALAALAEDAAVSPAPAEPSAGNIDLAAHDRRFHPHGYDPDRDTCSLRDDLDKGDDPDAAVGSAPSPQGDGWNPAERAEAERAAAALRRILDGVSVSFSNKPYADAIDKEVRLSRRALSNGREYVLVDVDQHLFDGKSEVEQKNLATKIIRDRFVNKVIGDGGAKAFVPKKAAKEFSRPASRKIHGELSNAKMRSSPELDTLLSTAVYLRHDPDDGGHPEAAGGWDYYDVIFKVGNKFYCGEVNLLVDSQNRRRFHDITHIHEETLSQLLQSTQGHSASTGTPAHEVLQGQTPAEGSSDATIVPNSSAECNGGSEYSLLRSDTGKVVGEYDRASGKITLYPGAKVADIVHEFSHGLWQFAEEEAAAGRRSLLDKMHEIAVSAPKSVKDAVSADYPEASDSVYLEECFTHEMARRSDTAFAKAVATDEGKPWYRKAWGAIKSIWNGYASKHGADKADIDKAASLPPAEAADFILGEMARGKKFGTVSHSGKDGGKRKSIIGEKGAASLGIGKLDEAQKMSKGGASRDDIWRKTGWWRGKDGKWRVEIPDIKLSRLVDTIPLMFVGRGHAAHVQAVEKLGDLIEKEDVLSAYPDLESLDVHFTHLPDGALGRYDRENNAIWIERDLTEDPTRKTELHSTLSHEIQHAIQDREGHASGGNLNTLEQGKRRIQDINKWLSGWMKDYGFKKWEEQTPQEDIIASLGRYSGRPFPQYLAFIDTLTRGDRNNAETGYKKAVKDLEKAKKIVPDTHHYDDDIDFYRSLSGEVESRNVEKRLAMTPEERAATPPWETEDVPEDRQIVRDSAPTFNPRAFARYLADN